MLRSKLPLALLAALTVSPAFTQGLSTTATKDDWEEINFAFDSATLIDGYASLLRLAELLGKNPTFKARLVGHTDWHGSKKYNEKLGNARGAMVKSFLEKYGARSSQIQLVSMGNEKPKVPGKDLDSDLMNRRVEITIVDGSGKPISAGGIGDAIRGLEANKSMGDQCCNEVLKRLDKLDDILAALRALKSENEQMKQQLAGVGGDVKKVGTDVEDLKNKLAAHMAAPPAGTGANNTNPGAAQFGPVPGGAAGATGQTGPAGSAGPGGGSGSGKGSGSSSGMDDNNFLKKFALLGLNAGPTADGKLTFTGKGRFFSKLSESTALQSEGEYMYFRDRKEGQFDFGLVNRYKRAQMGLFSSFKHVTFNQFENGGTLGQAAFTADYVFNKGRVGVFGTKAFMNNAVVNRAIITRNVFEETYLKAVDQIGVSTGIALYKDIYAEANLAYLKSRLGNDRPGGTIRLVKPLNTHIALSVEGGFNETMIGKDSNGRVAFGVLFGNFLRPQTFGTQTGPVPVDIPRVRYELLTRKVRTGNDPPVADAGPDQAGIASGLVNLDGSGSYSPEGNPITYQWTQIAGPAVSITNATSAKASFTSTDSQSYAFRLTVKDNFGGQGTARVAISTRAPSLVRILRFTANPPTIKSGATSTINWQVENADTVEISGIGLVDKTQGSTQVSPKETTTYKITAKNRNSEANETITITVDKPAVRIISFAASPANINLGQTSTLSWQTENADTVEIDGIGKVNVNGATPVSPKETTTYKLTARNQFGDVTATATVQVNGTPGGPVSSGPRIIRFDASPQEITTDQSSALSWLVENADTVTITSLGTVPLSGSRQVNPQLNTIYTITATNPNGQVSSTVAINVRAAAPKPPVLTSCSATPVSVNAGEPALISFTAVNANVVTFNGLGVSSPITVRPTVDTTYTLTAWGANQLTTTCQVLVKVNQVQAPRAPIANAGPNFDTLYREFQLDAGQSTDPDGLPLTYRWRIVDKTAAILEPNSQRTRVQLGEQFGTYTFELTVTNSKGVSSSTRVIVNFVSTRVF